MRRRNEVLVGIMTTVVVLVAIVGTLWLARGGLRKGYPLYSTFKWGAGLKTGQPVLLAGVNVGYVSNVKLRYDGYLDVEYRIVGDYHVPINSVATVVPVGIFGDQSIALTPKTAGVRQTFAAGDTVPVGPPAASIDQILSRVDTMSMKLGDVTQSIQFQLVQNGGLADIRKTIAQTAELTRQLNGIAAEQSRNLTMTLASFRRTISGVDSVRVDSTVRNLQATTQNLNQLTASLNTTTVRLDSVMMLVQKGDGTIGKLLRDPSVYNNLQDLLARTDSLLADLKANPKRYINLRVF
jgi:phospholipid/cholesterol/gamma-HCH transport system substrate-binding protein